MQLFADKLQKSNVMVVYGMRIYYTHEEHELCLVERIVQVQFEIKNRLANKNSFRLFEYKYNHTQTYQQKTFFFVTRFTETIFRSSFILILFRANKEFS